MAAPTAPTTVMFTDIEGSTRLLAALGDRYAEVLDEQRLIVRGIVAETGGTEVDTQGDAFFLVFPDSRRALSAAVAVQQALARHAWPEDVAVLVRIGLHTGTPVRTSEGYVGIDLHRGARICAAAHGGQVVLSEATRGALGDDIPADVLIRPAGVHRLKDLDEPVTLFDLAIDGLSSNFPPLRSIGSRPTNLPPEQPDLVGRDRERAALGRLVLDGPERLVTLTGPGGTGKTTLATRVAADLLIEHADGAFVVLLAPLTSPDGVAGAIAGTLQVREQVGRTYLDVVRDYLAERELLLLLDNFEHVAQAAPLVATLLAAAPRLRVIVTSRLALRVPGEREFPVPALAVATDPMATSRVTPAAVELFAQRARMVAPAFRLDAETEPAVTHICARLDGLPLAIELAAARIRLMTPAAMLARLERPLELAAHGPRHAPTRQQALRATIDWSYDLLQPGERRTLVRLGVFAAPFTIEAAEEICDAGLDDLAGLLDHSLLHSTAVDEVGMAGRLGMLATIRAYARDRLRDAGELDEVRSRHAAWFAAMVRPTTPELLSGAHEDLLPVFDAEQADFRVALDWLLASGQGNKALRLAADLAIFWDTRGQYAEGRARLEQALAAAVDPPVLDRAHALFSVGRMALIQGDSAGAGPALAEALPLFQDDARGVTLCLSHQAWAASVVSGGPARAERLNEQALDVARRSGDPWSIAVALNNHVNDSDFAAGPDNQARARTMLQESLDIRRRLGERRTLAITLANFGRLAIAEGRLDDAAQMLEEALSLAISLGFEAIVVEARQELARIAVSTGDVGRARPLLLDALGRSERTGDATGHAIALFGLARACSEQGDQAAAAAWRQRADDLTARTGLALTPFDRWEL